MEAAASTAPSTATEAPVIPIKPETTAPDPETKEAAEEKSAPKPQPKKYKLKVYDKEEEVDENEIVRRAQRASAADEKFRAAAETEKKYSSMVENLKKNPWELFKALNLDPHQAAEQLLIEKLKIETMSPEQRRAWELQQENETLKEKMTAAERAAEDAKKAVEENRYNEIKSETFSTIDQGIVKAIQDAGIKKATPSLVRRMAQKMLSYHHANGGQLLEPNVALKKVLDEVQGEWPEFLESLPESEYESRLPKAFVEKLRNWLISRVESPMASFSKQRSNTTAKPGKRVTSSTDDFFEQLEKRWK